MCAMQESKTTAWSTTIRLTTS